MDIADKYTYDIEYFLTLDKDKRYSFIKEFVNKAVSERHNPGLIKKEEQPNGNIIYKLYSNGTITREKGGWAYGQRSVFDVKYECVRPNTFFSFPEKGDRKGDTYAIMTEEECHKIRNIMDDMLLKC